MAILQNEPEMYIEWEIWYTLAKNYLSLNYFATFWIISNYDWFNKDLGAAFTKKMLHNMTHYGHHLNPNPSITTLWQENPETEYNSITKSYKCKSSFTHGVKL